MKIKLDIETIPAQPEKETKSAIAETIQAPAQMKKPETIEAWHNGEGQYVGVKEALIEEQYRKTALNGAQGEVISIGWQCEGQEINGVYRDLGESEEVILRKFFDDVLTHTATPYFVGFNITFDLKFLFHRSVILGINPGLKIPFDGRHSKDYFCLMQAWCGYRDRISQDNLCKALGIEGKPEDIDGSQVWDFVKTGKVERVAKYNLFDVETVGKLYRKLNFME